jgi:hypothetical protein
VDGWIGFHPVKHNGVIAGLVLAFASIPAHAAPTAAQIFIAASRQPDNACVTNPGALDNDSGVALKFEDMIERVYGAALVGERSVEREKISPAEMADMTRTMACVASWNGTASIADSFAALFASRRHGKAAFAALAVHAKNKTATASDRRAAQEFASQMRSYVKGPRK